MKEVNFYIYVEIKQYINKKLDHEYALNLYKNKFVSNQAFQCGGGIKFDNIVPSYFQELSNINNFHDNISPYGSDYASYPIRITISASIYFIYYKYKDYLDIF